ncbi:MAG: hypothetical protein NTW50_00310 [Candidatus Berkelbacteria bacterium]|nr:hypothetical protein [Candidatus Berkelbacteria bacterium]
MLERSDHAEIGQYLVGQLNRLVAERGGNEYDVLMIGAGIINGTADQLVRQSPNFIILDRDHKEEAMETLTGVVQEAAILLIESSAGLIQYYRLSLVEYLMMLSEAVMSATIGVNTLAEQLEEASDCEEDDAALPFDFDCVVSN